MNKRYKKGYDDEWCKNKKKMNERYKKGYDDQWCKNENR